MSSEQTRRTFFKSAAVAGFPYAIGGRHLSAETAADQPPDADLILMNRCIATQDERRSLASTVAINDGRFLAVGSDQDVLAYRVDRPPDGCEEVSAMLSQLLEAHEIILVDAHDAAARVAALDNDGTNDLLVSDVIRTGELQVWFLAEHLVDTPLVRA
jgi:hypothetical protein